MFTPACGGNEIPGRQAINNPRAGSARQELLARRRLMADEKVGITGLTVSESEEIHRNLIQGTQIFGIIAALAHLLAYIYSPWLH
jgi:light-harvesting protein B-800-850 beta chain